MKKFLFKISFYIIGVVAVLLFLGTFADGNTDDNYRHFTGPKPSNMIMGDSRGVQAVVPDILDAKFKDRKFTNFAFNIADSPYGKVYFEAIKKKLNPNTQNGIFILTVDPWSVSIDKGREEKDLPETRSPLASMHFYDINPNYEYLLRNYPRSWFNIYKDREEVAKSNTYLHKNGWMEVTVDVHPDTVAARTVKKVEEAILSSKKQEISTYRLKSLENIIDFLKTKGSVYIVRIPPSEKVLEIEKKYSPDFSKRIKAIAEKQGIGFFDFSPEAKKYTYTDGNHMYKESGKVFTAQIADSILLHTKTLK